MEKIKDYLNKIFYRTKKFETKIKYYVKKIFHKKKIGEMEAMPISVINDKNIEKMAYIQEKTVVNGHLCTHINLNEDGFFGPKDNTPKPDPKPDLKTIQYITVPVRHKKSRIVVIYRGTIEDLKKQYDDNYEIVETAIKE